MSPRIILLALFIFACFRFIISPKHDIHRFHYILLSSMIQSLMIYPLLYMWIQLPEKTRNPEFCAPFENNIGILYPTIISLIIYLSANRKRAFYWKQIGFSLFSIIALFIYSFISPYNYSRLSTIICLLLFVQIFFVVYVLKRCIHPTLFLNAVYDGFKIIIIVEAIISIPFVFFDVDSLQALFYSSETDVDEFIREGTMYKYASGTMTHHNRLGALCSYISLFYLSCLIFKYKRNQSIFLFITSILVLILSQSRSAIIATLFASCFIICTYLKKMRVLSFGKFCLFVSISAVVAILLLNTDLIYSMFFNSNVDDMSVARQTHYLLGWVMLQKNNFLGTGINSHVHYLYNNMMSGRYNLFFFINSIHNIHLVILVETGIVGICLWLYFIFSRIKRFLMAPLVTMKNPIICFVFIAMIVTIIIWGFTDYALLHFQYLILLFLFGAMYGYKDEYKTFMRTTPQK